MTSTEPGTRPLRTALRLALLLLLSIVVLSPSVGFTSEAVTRENAPGKLANASSAADHELLAAYFRAEAAEAAAEVDYHETMLKAVRRIGGKANRGNRLHCRNLIRAHRMEQEALEDLAADHEMAAKEAVR